MKYLILALLIMNIKPDCSKNSDELCQRCYLGICTKCYISYFDPRTQSCEIPETIIDNCENLDIIDGCTKCLSGYFLKSKTCHKITDEKCLSAKNETGECEVCKNGKLLDPATNTCSEISCKTENCRDCKFDVIEECVRCDAGHRLDLISLLRGYKCTPTDDFCGSSNPIGGNCDKCEDGYFMKGEVCQKSSKIPTFDAVLDSGNENENNGTFSFFLNTLLLLTYLI